MANKLATCFALSLLITSSAVGATLNEIRISQSGSDDDVGNFFELAGTPGESLDGLTVLSVSGEFEPGEISFAFSLDGLTIPDDGFFLASGDDMFYGDATDFVTDADFFGSPQIFALVSGFTGMQGDDLDGPPSTGEPTGDGELDSEPWSDILDAIALIDGEDPADATYGAPTVGPDGDFPPAHIYRDADGDGDWVQGLFGDLSADTPGSSNFVIPEPSAALLGLIGFGSLLLARRRK